METTLNNSYIIETYKEINNTISKEKINPFEKIISLSTNDSSNISYYINESNNSPNLNNNLLDNNEKGNEKIEKPKNEYIKNKTIMNISNTIAKSNIFKVSNLIEIVPVPIIQNIVSTAKFGCNLKLEEIRLSEKTAKYNPKRFRWLIMRINEPKTTMFIFPNGNIVCLGAKTEENSKNACLKLRKILKKLNYPVNFKDFKIINIVGSCKLNFKINLGLLNIYMKKYMPKSKVSYEPELFPGLIYKYLSEKKDNSDEKLNIVFLIFASGNIVIAGAKKRKQIYDAFENIYSILSICNRE